ncbi:octanoyl-[GcvH]:protein N-octanoyltransferase [Oceanobacillus oncorhynchi subsp. incaldanensis]|uniref:lipoate--protein ligase family protein n=1 Tax=Oceanobacillus oncorhynchi TaxID=545501 RepID=UPI001B2E151A|nr:lipoate--protein ligase family protein [Oceanobacillus oncorhynchi]GIO19060.1 octanoyl-[GcvH]:protein N-octanoyltransferase [Oceanobacillus oncorhynchi subsp. incaldanensis]
MKNWKEIIRHKTFRYIDHSTATMVAGKPNTALASFAMDDALAISVSEAASPPVIRLWVHPDTIVLGIPDSRLPHIDAGMAFLEKKNYQGIVRNSGGLAVALDEGVLNISLIIPGANDLSIYDCYEAMVQFVQAMFADLTDAMEAYEIVGSYCPGDYDLSINGKKFAGISQRRVKKGISVQIYLDIEGNSKARASLIREFYHIAKQNEETTFTYPEVTPDVMASLSDLLGIPLTVEEVKQRVMDTLNGLTEEIITMPMQDTEQENFDKRYQQMIKRNENI